MKNREFATLLSPSMEIHKRWMAISQRIGQLRAHQCSRPENSSGVDHPGKPTISSQPRRRDELNLEISNAA